MTPKAQDYLFALQGDEEQGVFIGIVEKAHFVAEGFMDDTHLGEILTPIWPAGVEMDEVQESFFMVGEEMTLDVVKAKFIAAGFEYSQPLQDLMDGV